MVEMSERIKELLIENKEALKNNDFKTLFYNGTAKFGENFYYELIEVLNASGISCQTILDNWDGNTLLPIFKWSFANESIIIPDNINVVYGLTCNASDFNKIEFSKNMETIPYGCCAGCLNLKEVIIPEGVEKIEWQAFADCPLLSEVQLPETLREIYHKAFYGCKNLTKLVIPGPIESIKSVAFRKTGLQFIEIDATNLTHENIGADIFKGTQLKQIIIHNNAELAQHFSEYRKYYGIWASTKIISK